MAGWLRSLTFAFGRLRMRDTTFVIEILEVFFGTLGVGLVVFGIARGIHANEKLAFIPVGLALAALVFWNQRKRKKKGDKLSEQATRRQITAANAGWRSQFRIRGSRHWPGVAEFYWRMDARYLNEVAQQLRSLEESSAAFERLSHDEQLSVLQSLEFMAHQAHATPHDVPTALIHAEAEPSFSPAWSPDTSGVHSVTDQHYAKRDAADLLGQYRYLMALYSLADGRRRVDCAGQCSHWWHHLQRA